MGASAKVVATARITGGTSLKMTNQLTQACQMTEQIIALVESDQFEKVFPIDEKRQQLIHKIFSVDKTAIDVQLAQQLLALNRQAEQLMRTKRKAVMEQQIKHKRGEQIASLYTSSS